MDMASFHAMKKLLLGKIKSRSDWKTVLDSCSDLKICQFADLFHANDILRQPFILQVFLELILRYFRSKYLDLCGIMNLRHDLVVILTEMVPEAPVAYFLG